MRNTRTLLSPVRCGSISDIQAVKGDEEEEEEGVNGGEEFDRDVDLDDVEFYGSEESVGLFEEEAKDVVREYAVSLSRELGSGKDRFYGLLCYLQVAN